MQGAFDFSKTTPWPAGVVPYRYDSSVRDSVKKLFETAIREWQINASLNFVPRTSSTGNQVLIKFTGYQPSAAMNSFVGVKGGAQDLNMVHEQSRSDRDTFVTVFANNLVDSHRRELCDCSIFHQSHGL